MITRLLLAALLALPLTGCDNPAPGEACEVSGDGFTRQDPCADTCVEWAVTCPDGAEVIPGVCSDGACSTDADCGSGWFCAEINMTDSECLPEDVCPTSDALAGEDAGAILEQPELGEL